MTTRQQELAIDFTTLLRRHQAGLWRYLRALGCEASLADDLTQDAFMTLLEKPFEFRGHLATAAYLRTVARNKYISHCRQGGRVVDLDEVETVSEDWNKLVRDEDAEETIWALRSCFDALTERSQMALSLRYRENASREEIAGRLDMTADGVKTLLRRSRAKLRECLERKVQNEEPINDGT